jgi:hypothetical protein
MAKKYLLNAAYFDPLANGHNILPGKHAYSHVIALSSAAKAYAVLGDLKYLDAIRNAWNMLETTQRYASGGWGPKEAFVEPHEGKLAETITSTHEHFETPCGCYAQFKLARYLLRFTADARYGDSLERVLYNTLLGARDPDGVGNYFYYSDYHPNASKGYYHAKWPCCSGTLVQGVVDYLINSYFHSSDGLYVNLFTPSEVQWTMNAVPIRLTQRTTYPVDGSIEFRVSVPKATHFAVYVRIPGWLQSSPEALVNGKPFDGPMRNGTFAVFRRKWKEGDTIQIKFPITARTESIDDHSPNTVAVMRGPLMLVAVNPPPDLASTALALPQALRPSPDPLTMEYETGGRKVQFRPFYTVGSETYTTYLRKSVAS